jgi:hypothetical protein
MPRYKLRVPGPGTWLYGDGPSAVVADTIQAAREFFEEYEGDAPQIYLSSYIGSCRVVYKRDIEVMDCHDEAEPGDTTVDYLADNGRELRDHEVRVWVGGWQGPISLVNRDTPSGRFEEMPPGVKVKHPVWGWGTTVARPLKHRTGWRVLVEFSGALRWRTVPGRGRRHRRLAALGRLVVARPDAVRHAHGPMACRHLARRCRRRAHRRGRPRPGRSGGARRRPSLATARRVGSRNVRCLGTRAGSGAVVTSSFMGQRTCWSVACG